MALVGLLLGAACAVDGGPDGTSASSPSPPRPASRTPAAPTAAGAPPALAPRASTGLLFRAPPTRPPRDAREPGPVAAARTRIVYLNRFGGTYKASPAADVDDSLTNESAVLAALNQPEAVVPAFAGGDVQWNELVVCVGNMFERYSVVLTESDPGAIDHIEAVVGGSAPDDVMTPGPVYGVAVMKTDCSVSERAIVYIFEQTIGPNQQTVCEVIAQEIAHALGLDHEMQCNDPMTYLPACGTKTFQDVLADCGENAARPCFCDDTPGDGVAKTQQNSHQQVLAALGPDVPDGAAPTVTVTSPGGGTTIERASTITVDAVDDVAVLRVDLYVDGTRLATDGTAPYELVVPTSLADGPYTFEIQAQDAKLNTGTTTLDVIVEGGPTGGGPDGGGVNPGDPGWPCSEPSECNTGICHDDGTKSLCTEPCFDQSTLACPTGLVCLGLEDGEGYCWPAEGIFSGGGLFGGCAAAPGGRASWPGLALVLAGAALLLRRRRTRRVAR